MINLANHKELHKQWEEYNREFGSDTDYQDWLEYLLLHRTELLKQAEERASHHAAIASVCSATAERYAAALDSIAELTEEFASSLTESGVRYLIESERLVIASNAKAKEARKEAE